MSNTLYVFGHSVWSAVDAELINHELGYPEGEITMKLVNVVKAENFEAAFLQVNPNGTVPPLELADGKVYTSTAGVTAYLIQHATLKVKPATPSIIDAIHDAKYDPNLALLFARNEAEVTKKKAGLPGAFFANHRNKAACKDFYEPRLVENTGLLVIYEQKAPPDAQTSFFAQCQAHWAAVRSALFEVFPAFLPARGGFIRGAVPGEDDFYMIASLTRIAFLAGANSGADGLRAFENEYGAPVPENVALYWQSAIERPSWKKVYNGIPH
ncbi:hypothetical protein B0H11DRAFT_2163757 [Mycena galericulata]|nr:hypothetical protein B0H11DRAFT_2163757 [Mycena galericulata]